MRRHFSSSTDPTPVLVRIRFIGRTSHASAARMLWSSSIGSRTPPLLVLCGAFSNVADAPPELYRRLSGRSDRMIVFCDHRDSGRSPSSAQAYAIDDMANDAMRLMQAHPRFGVVGISMGGLVGQHMAAAYPERIESLTLLMSTCNPRRVAITPSMQREYVYASRDQPIRSLLLRWRTHGAPTMSRETRNRRLRRMLDHGFQYRMGHGRAFLGYTGPDTRKIKCPTMIVHGKYDNVFPVDHAYELHSHIEGAHLRILDEVGHDIHDDNLDHWLAPILTSPKKQTFFFDPNAVDSFAETGPLE